MFANYWFQHETRYTIKKETLNQYKFWQCKCLYCCFSKSVNIFCLFTLINSFFRKNIYSFLPLVVSCIHIHGFDKTPVLSKWLCILYQVVYDRTIRALRKRVKDIIAYLEIEVLGDWMWCNLTRLE